MQKPENNNPKNDLNGILVVLVEVALMIVIVAAVTDPVTSICCQLTVNKTVTVQNASRIHECVKRFVKRNNKRDDERK